MNVNGAGGVEIATKDWGGDGIPLLLTHGAFFHKETLDMLVPLLQPTFRVVTFDMRNHGGSGEGPWEWSAVTADVEAVRAAYGIERPVVAGHSLGGMVAAAYARDYPECRAAINIDGHGRGKPSQYDGMEEAAVLEAWAALDEQEAQMIATLDKPRFVEMLAEIKELDMIGLWESVPCPFLLFNCVAEDPAYAAMNFGDMADAYRRGLQIEFEAIAAQRSSIEVAKVDHTHISIILDPAELAQRMIAFVASTPA